MCHVLLLMPFLGLSVFWIWPVEMALPVYTVILMISGILYFFIIKAQHEPVHVGREALLHQIGQVIAPLSPDGLIRLRGEIWRASSSEMIPRGDHVEVVGLDGLTLLVQKPHGTNRTVKQKHCII